MGWIEHGDASYIELKNARIAALESQLAEAKARIRRLSGILTGATRQETADKIIAATNGRMNTRSVWILADELMQPPPPPPASAAKGEGE